MAALTRRVFAYLLLALLVAFAGCSGGGSGGAGGADQGAASSGGQEQVTTAGAGAAPTNGQQADVTANSQAVPQGRQRALIRTGKVALEVDNFTRTRERLIRVVQQSNGFVSDSRERVHQEENQTWRTGRLVVRVPKDNFTGVFEAIKATGTVRTATTSTEDVTKQLVDIEARLRNLRAQRSVAPTLQARERDRGSLGRSETTLGSPEPDRTTRGPAPDAHPAGRSLDHRR